MPWQRSVFPAPFQPKIKTIHDGIDTDLLTPCGASFTHRAIGEPIKTGDEVVTFVARNLDPYRGFHVFMRALPRIMAARPNARICIAGGNDIGYGSAPVGAENWKAALLDELRGRLDLRRVYFLGALPYDQFIRLLRISRVHAYLTYPFVLSWSLLEALALGCVVVASDTAPVRDVIVDGENGLLVPFLEPAALAEKIVDVLAAPKHFTEIGRHARAGVVKQFRFESTTFPQYLALIEALAGERLTDHSNLETTLAEPSWQAERVRFAG